MNASSNSLLHELPNNEAILLMYLANELPAQDRAEVEHMLDRDDSLRLELAKVQQMYQGYHDAMRQIDATLPPASAFAAARAVGDVVRSRQIEPASVDDHDDHPRRMHWAIYPAVAAAVLFVGMFLWWRYPVGDDPTQPQVMVTDGSTYGQEFRRGPDDGMRGDFGEFDWTERRILRVFEPMSLDRGWIGPESESQRQIAAIRFLDSSLQ